MTDGQTLFVVFAALYLLESLRWLPVRAWLCAGSGRQWVLRQPLSQIQGNGWGLVPLPMLPPVPAHLVMLPWLLVPRAEGVIVCDQEEGAPSLLPWADLSPWRAGATVFLTDHQRLRLPSQVDAEAALATLQRWVTMDPAARDQDFLATAQRSLDGAALRSVADQLCHHTRFMRGLSLVIFVWCFGVIAAVYWWLGDSAEVLAAAAVLLLLQWTQAVLFWRAANTSTLGTVKHRFWKALAMGCLPQIAMRAPDVVSKAVPATAHPLASRGLIDERSWLQLARRFWKQARYGFDGGDSLAARALAAFFEQQQIDAAQLEPVPERQAGSAAYCPRCLAQFRDAANVCADCGGVTLKQWEA